MVLMILSINSFEMNRLNPFPTLTAPYPLIFHSVLSNMDEVALVTKLGKTSLAKRNSKVY